MSSTKAFEPSGSHVSFHDSTFKTAIDFTINGADDADQSKLFNTTQQSNKLPPDFDVSALFTLPTVVNFVALRETFLSEAPFIRKANRAFWKKWIDSTQYFKILCGSLRLISDCITENGIVLADKLYQIDLSNPMMANTNNDTNRIQNPLQTPVKKLLLDEIAISTTEMLMMDRSKRIHAKGPHDTLFDRLPEMLVYMTVHSLFNTMPKLSRVFYSIKFRELLVDWFNELIFGWRLTSNHNDCEWLYREANEISIIIQNQPNKLSQSIRETKRIQAKEQATYLAASMKTTSSNNSVKPHSAPSVSFMLASDKDHQNNNTSNNSVFPSTATHHSGTMNSMKLTTSSRTQHTNNTNQGNDDNQSMTSESHASSTVLPKITRSQYGTARSRFHLKNSPLVSLYLNMGRKSGMEGWMEGEEDWESLDGSVEEKQSSFKSTQGRTITNGLHPITESSGSMKTSSTTTGSYDSQSIGSDMDSRSSASSLRRKPPQPPAPYVCQHPLSLGLSHVPNRPIVSMQMNIVQEEHKFRPRAMTHEELRKTLEISAMKRAEVLTNKDMFYQKMRQDVDQMHQAFEIQLAILQKKPVSQKQLLAAATAMEQVKLIGSTSSVTMGTGSNNAGIVSSNSSVNNPGSNGMTPGGRDDDNDSLMDGH